MTRFNITEAPIRARIILSFIFYLNYNNSVPIPTVSKKPIKPMRNSIQSIISFSNFKNIIKIKSSVKLAHQPSLWRGYGLGLGHICFPFIE